jgi:16S rRNA (guanine527-N7)-methyltransferase
MTDSHRALAALADRFGLPDRAADQLVLLLGCLVEDPLAPTAVTDPRKAVDDHLADSLVALELEPVCRATTIADLGSGAGLPGLPLAIALPGARVSLVESAARKCEFLERARTACGLDNVEVVNARAEQWPDGLRRFDLVTARALAPLPVVLEYAAPLMQLGGTVAIWRGHREPGAEAAAERAARELGLEPGEIRKMSPYAGALQRYLHLMSKVMETPERFPRRPGMASKRPLGQLDAKTVQSDRSQR